MDEKADFSPQKFAVIGAGPVGCIVAAFLAQKGYDVTLCDIMPELLEPALDPGITIEGAENLLQTVSSITTSIDELADPPDVIFITVKANALPLIVSAIEGFYHDGMFVVSWQNGIDTELEISPTPRRPTRHAGRRELRMWSEIALSRLHAVSPSPALYAGARSAVRNGRTAIANALTQSGLATAQPTRLFRWSGARRS